TRQGAGSVETAWGGSLFAQTACPHGRQAAHRSAIDASVIDASRRVQVGCGVPKRLLHAAVEQDHAQELLGCLDLVRPPAGLACPGHSSRLRREVWPKVFK